MTDGNMYDKIDFNKEAIFGLLYFAGYVGYLVASLESELMHWVTLVCLPLILLYVLQRKTLPTSSLRMTLASVGLEKGNIKNGLPWAIVVGLALGCLQLFASQRRDAIWQILKSGKVFYLFPLVLLLMLFTAGFTEEFFFRGVLQTRLARLLRSNLWAVVLTSILFGFYHLPYAYLNPRWPSHGDWAAAMTSAFTQGGLGGLILGAVYVKARFNLLACIVVHSLINALPGMTLIKFGGP